MNLTISILKITLVGLVIGSRIVLSQDYLWPTNSSEYMASSFCEFRDGHYHAAIDIKTWNTEGYTCYAIEDGFIKRIRVSPFGYGKVLYLQLKDGNTAVYAHLQKFTPEIDNMIKQQQFKNQKYRLNWWPKNVKVKKGDIIAYTGRTGIGVPHLHFEIRNEKDRPVNPLKYYNQVKDHKRPRLQNLAVIPLSKESTVNDNYLPQKFPLSHIKDGIYVVKKPIYIDGDVGFAVRGYDQADEVYNKYGFYRSTLESDGKLIFELTYDELNFSTTEHIYTEIYYPFWSGDREVFNKLYLESFNPLSFYNRKLNSDGILRVNDEPIPFTITISDYMNNRSIIKGELLPAQFNSLDILNTTMRDSSIYIKFTAPQIRDLRFFLKRDDQPWKTVSFFEILEGSLNEPQTPKLVRIDLTESTNTRLKIRVNKTIEKMISIDKFVEREEISEDFIYMGANLVGEFPGKFMKSWAQDLQKKITVPYRHNRDNKLQVYLTSNMISGKSLFLNLEDLHSNSGSIMLDHQSLIPGEKKLFYWFDSSLVIQSASGSVTDTTLITAFKHEPDSTLTDIPLTSDIYEIKPDNFPVFESISVSIKADSLPSWAKWSVFKTNGTNRFRYLPSKIDSNAMLITTKTSSFGKFVIAADTVSPELKIESPVSGKVYKSKPKIKIYLKDTLSGFGDENNFSLSIDGKYVLPEWDPEEDFIIGFLENKLSSGNHIFTVSIRDRSGNTTRQAVYFKIQ